MPHFPKPIVRSKKNRWDVQLNRKHVSFGPEKEAAFRSYSPLMADRKKLAVQGLAARRPDKRSAVQLHVQLPAAGRRAVAVPPRRADALAVPVGRATR